MKVILVKHLHSYSLFFDALELVTINIGKDLFILSLYRRSSVVREIFSEYHSGFDGLSRIPFTVKRVPLEAVLCKQKVSCLDELISSSPSDFERIRFAIEFGEGPACLSSIPLTSQDSLDGGELLQLVFDFHGQSPNLYIWVRQMYANFDASFEGMNFIDRTRFFRIQVHNPIFSEMFKILCDAELMKSRLFSNLETLNCFPKHSLELELIRNPEMFAQVDSNWPALGTLDGRELFNNRLFLKCDSRDECSRFIKFISSKDEFFAKFGEMIDLEKIDLYRTALEFWKSDFPKYFNDFCPLHLKKYLEECELKRKLI